MQKPAFALLATLLAAHSTCQTAAPPSQQPTKEMAEVAAAYAAKITASALFVSGRTLDSVLAEELAPTRPLETAIRPFLKFDIVREDGTVTCRLLGATAVAVRTSNLGCTLVHPDVTADRLRAREAPSRADDLSGADPAVWPVKWPLGDRMPEGKPEAGDPKALTEAIDAAFAEPATGPRMNTRALVVVFRGQLIAERYAAGYRADMALPGWSMSKTIVNALVGIRIAQGALDPEAPLAVPEWNTTPDDPRQKLRLHDLLSMSSGLAWNESYDDPQSDALRMLFRSSDHGGVFARQPQSEAPGVKFRYSSGCTNLVCRILRGTFASDADYWGFPGRALFGPLGMRTAVLETDPSGTFVGSSYGFMCARDWARFGLLYANDGEVAGRRILPKGWVARSARSGPCSEGSFGDHIWLNADPDGDGPRERKWADLPADLMRMDGHEGQYVIILPTEQIVIVRLGCTKSGGFDLHGLARRVRDALRR
jgi:CubicO group peptidase (beta-lactamase class C family)